LPALWVSADAYYDVGGKTSVDGVGQNNMLRLGAGMVSMFGVAAI